MDADELLDVYGVAYVLGLSPRTAYRLMHDRTLPAVDSPSVATLGRRTD